MSIPKSTNAWVVTNTEGGIDNGLEKQTKDLPSELAPTDVLVRMKAVSLNYRDLIIPQGKYGFPANTPVVAASDGAGEVVAIGSGVTDFKVGDAVTTLFNQEHQSGPVNPKSIKSGLGGAIDGALREYGVFPEHGLVAAPKNLSLEEAATLPCAALTAWNALYGLKPLKPGGSVLVQGSGGVSVFALQFAKAAGAFVVATTSSEEKAQRLKDLGADVVINYKTTPNWGAVARANSPRGEGIDHIIEVGGPATLEQSFAAIKLEGIISMIGFVAGQGSKAVNPLDALSKVCTIRGVFVGSKEMMQAMNSAIEVNNIKPIVDEQVFDFDQTREAYHYQLAQKHFGKVVIRINA